MTREECTKRYFESDQFVKGAGIEIQSISEEQVRVQAKINDGHLNANGCVQGGMLYTLADFAFAVLGNYLHPATVTQSGKIDYLRPAYTSLLTAVATETARVGHSTVSQVHIYDDKEQIVCICTFNGFVKDVPLEQWMEKVRNTGEKQ